MKLIVGLGNPGEKYKNNRHNVGFLVADELGKLNLTDTVLVKPQKFMNKSGVAVKKLTKRYSLQPNSLFVVHDDLDIELGKFKIGQKGPKVHNGLKSIYEQLGYKNFWHVRVGIDNRIKTAFKGTGEDYVLQNFRPEEREIINKLIPIILINLINLINGKR
ncbi:MAG: aminoacyl-tRNA hydrolase [Candidatus Beckwithbacteria bacterium]|nr:aminoacyl-tRNA hydrolase [Candidatus Beckwithbacteria bacterium]